MLLVFEENRAVNFDNINEIVKEALIKYISSDDNQIAFPFSFVSLKKEEIIAFGKILYKYVGQKKLIVREKIESSFTFYPIRAGKIKFIHEFGYKKEESDGLKFYPILNSEFVNKPKGKLGEIVLITGPMYAGKSSYLLKLSEISRCWIIKALNTKSIGENIITHSFDKYDKVSYLEKMSDMNNELMLETLRRKVLCIDEAQFISDCPEHCRRLVSKGINIYIGALSSTFEMKPWSVVSELSAMSDKHIVQHSTCYYCKKEASFSKRITKKTEEIVIDPDEYVPVCRGCYFKEM